MSDEPRAPQRTYPQQIVTVVGDSAPPPGKRKKTLGDFVFGRRLASDEEGGAADRPARGRARSWGSTRCRRPPTDRRPRSRCSSRWARWGSRTSCRSARSSWRSCSSSTSRTGRRSRRIQAAAARTPWPRRTWAASRRSSRAPRSRSTTSSTSPSASRPASARSSRRAQRSCRTRSPLCLAILLASDASSTCAGSRESGITFLLPTTSFVATLGLVIVVGVGQGDRSAAVTRRRSLRRPPLPASTEAVEPVAPHARVRQRVHGDDGRRGSEQRRAASSASRRCRTPQRTLTVIIAILVALLARHRVPLRARTASARREPGEAGYQSILSQLVARRRRARRVLLRHHGVGRRRCSRSRRTRASPTSRACAACSRSDRFLPDTFADARPPARLLVRRHRPRACSRARCSSSSAASPTG